MAILSVEALSFLCSCVFMRYLSNIHSIIICKLKICLEKTQFQKKGMLMKKYLLNQKGCFECDSKVRGGNLTKAVDFSAFEKFDFNILTRKIFP